MASCFYRELAPNAGGKGRRSLPWIDAHDGSCILQRKMLGRSCYIYWALSLLSWVNIFGFAVTRGAPGSALKDNAHFRQKFVIDLPFPSSAADASTVLSVNGN